MPQKKVTRVEFPTKPLLLSQLTLLKRVAAYARVSTMKDAQENSLQSQQEYFTEYIRQHPDWVFAGMYTDDGVSGLSIRRRDGFNRMVHDALDGKIDLILTKSLSRFARNTVDALTTIRKLKAAGVAVYFQRENINTMDSTGEFLLTLMSSFAEEESRSISENVAWAVRRQYAQGIYHLPGLLLGYQRSQDGEIQVDEAGAGVVRFIYLLALAGISSTDICRILMEYNIPSPGESEVWESKTVRSILKNEKYMGDAILQKQVTVDFLTKTSKPNEGEAPQYYVENGYPGVISKAVWQEVQVKWTDAGRRNCTFSPFANRIVCGDCGGWYGRKTWHSTTYRDTVWECNRKKAGHTKCRCRHIYVEELDTAVRNSMQHLLQTHKHIIADCADLLEQTLGAISAEARSALKDIAQGKLNIQIDALMIRILISEMLVTPKQNLVVHFLDGTTYRHRLGATPRGTRLYNTKRDHSQMLALSAKGCSAKEISQRLEISVNTVRSFLRRKRESQSE